MTSTTLTTETAQRQYEISEAVHKVGDMYYQGSIPEAKYTGQPIEIHIPVASRSEVEDFAAANDLDVRVIRPGDGTQQATARLVIEPDAVALIVTHIRAAA